MTRQQIIDTYKIESHPTFINRLPERLKNLESDVEHRVRKEIMGVSQWKEYGKRFGYWDYFKKNK